MPTILIMFINLIGIFCCLVMLIRVAKDRDNFLSMLWWVTLSALNTVLLISNIIIYIKKA